MALTRNGKVLVVAGSGNVATGTTLRAAVGIRWLFRDVDTGGPADHVVGHLRKHNILVGVYRLRAVHSRIFGTPDDMRAFSRAWDLLPGSGHGHKVSM